MNQQFQLYNNDCDKILPTLVSGSVDLIIEDGPYHKVKGDEWDNRHKTVDEFIAWKRTILEQYQRILKPNGSLYVFASPQMAWHVEGVVRERFNVLNNIRWQKDAGWHNKNDEEELRGLLKPWEAIIFAEQFGGDSLAADESGYYTAAFHLHKQVYRPLGEYFQTARERVGLTRNDVEVALGYVSSADPTRGTALCCRWEEGSSLPTNQAYERLQTLLNTRANGSGPVLTRTYRELREQYEDLREQYEDLRRPFNATPDAPYTDVWTFPTVMNYPGKHVCEKPLALMEHIIRLSSKPGAVVLDCFMGSGTTGHACATVGDRNFIGIEQSREWFDKARRRIKDAERIKKRQPKQLAGTESDYASTPLFAGL